MFVDVLKASLAGLLVGILGLCLLIGSAFLLGGCSNASIISVERSQGSVCPPVPQGRRPDKGS